MKKNNFKKLTLLPIFSLTFVALLQVFFSTYRNLSPWKGGGFGMFSSLNNPGMRRLSVRLTFIDGQESLVSSKQFIKMPLYDQLRAFPSEEKLFEFIEKLKSLKWKHRYGDSEEYLRIDSLGRKALCIEVLLEQLIYDQGVVRAEKILSHRCIAK